MTRDAVHPFDQAITLAGDPAGARDGDLGKGYANMVGPFGGTIAAALLQAVMEHPQRLGNPIASTVNFAGPIADAPFTVRAEPVRTNRSTQHWNLLLEQGGQIAVTGSVVCATRHDSWSDNERSMPQVAAPETLPMFANPASPVWTRRYDLRFASGQWGLDPVPPSDSQTHVWVRDAEPRPLDFLSLMAMSDVFFPRVFLRKQTFCPAGTITLSTYFHATPDSLAKAGTDYLLGIAQARRFHQGYFDQGAELWSRDGELLVTSSQMVYFKV
ncbi:acyl-CoA thioesterase [Isoalcanivorax beigongshangi]|uniref:Acyl-CoA thioesterase n=1 Tax=Isoalcanivorax beigongshangi TaxID=3238810 RepID=A0ABV4AHC3_9GAMM